MIDTLAKDDADTVTGSCLDGEIRPRAMPPLHQYLGSRLLTKSLNIFYDVGVTDAHSGMRIIKAEVIAELNLQTDGMEFASEMIMEAATKDLLIVEVPITYHERVSEATLDSFNGGWRHVKFVLTNAPGYLFTVPAVGCVLVGVAVIAASLAAVQWGPVTSGLQTLVVGILCAVVGYQVGSLALFSSVAADPIRHPTDPITNVIHDHFTLETDAACGVVVFTVGALGLTYSVVAWTIHGYAAVLSIEWDLLAAAGIITGVQTVFNSFFITLVV